MAIADLIMPKMGESIMEATILKWHKRVGDYVKLDETVLDIATDKVDSEIPSPVAGIIEEILFPVNNVVPVGSVIAKIQTDISISIEKKSTISSTNNNDISGVTFAQTKEPAPIVSEYSSNTSFFSHPVQQHITQHIQEPDFMESTHKSYEENTPFQPFTTAPKTGNNRFFSPLVLNIANSEGIALSELERIPGTGADGRVSKKDVLQYIADKRAGIVAAFVPKQATTQVVYAPQPAVQEQYNQPIEEPIPVQHFVHNKVADTPIYIAPQPLVEPIIESDYEHALHYKPIIETPIEHISFNEPVIYPHPIQENIIHEPLAEQVFQPIVEPENQQRTVVEPISYQVTEPVQTVLPKIVEQESKLTEPPVFESIIEPVQEVVQPLFVPTPQPIIEPVQVKAQQFVAPVPQPIIEPVQAIEQPFVAPVPQPIIEPVQAIAQPFVAPALQPIVEPVQEITQPEVEVAVQQIVEPIHENVQPIVETETLPVSEHDIPIAETKVEMVVTKIQNNEPIQAQESTQSKPIPVFMIPATAPTVPLVTLAEGGSGKFTSPDSAHPSGNVEIIEMDRMRKLISNHMVESKNISAHVTSFTEADVTNMVLWRERVKVDFERREGTKLTFTPMFIDCVVKVLKRYPLLNSSVQGDKIIIKKDLNIGMATALPTGNLIVPVIKGADQLNIVGLSAAVNKLATSARANQLKPDDVTGGTFTFTNVGTFGTLMGTPIINQPQVAILAVGVIKKRPVVIESPNNDTIGIRHMMYLSLSYDHRIIDGSVGASFLSDVAKEMENWDLNRTWYHYL